MTGKDRKFKSLGGIIWISLMQSSTSDRASCKLRSCLVRPPMGRSSTCLAQVFGVSENGLVMTARHVIEDAQRLMASLPGSRLMIGQGIPSITDPEFTIRGSFNYLLSKVAEEDPRHDIALIQAMQNPFATEQRPFIKAPAPDADVYPLLGLATLSTSEVRDGEHIGVSGYPLAEPALVTTSGGVASALGVNIQQAQALGAPPWLHHTEYR